MERTLGINPTSMIAYTNEKAVMWKLQKISGSRRTEK